jgi:hypothetical protein
VSLNTFSDINYLPEDGQGSKHARERTAYRVLLGKSEGKRQLKRPMHRWVDNIQMYQKVIY